MKRLIIGLSLLPTLAFAQVPPAPSGPPDAQKVALGQMLGESVQKELADRTQIVGLTQQVDELNKELTDLKASQQSKAAPSVASKPNGP